MINKLATTSKYESICQNISTIYVMSYGVIEPWSSGSNEPGWK